LKAIDIINFINEDKFSKYTLKQIYDELGSEEDFLNYLEDLFYKVVKSTKSTLLKKFKLDTKNSEGNKVFIKFEIEKERIYLYMSYSTTKENLIISSWSRDKSGYIEGAPSPYTLEAKATNILPELQKLTMRSLADLAKERADIHI
jgi:hypothetical protein